jgi:formiminotetrahydrofolate cyclodeaminase
LVDYSAGFGAPTDTSGNFQAPKRDGANVGRVEIDVYLDRLASDEPVPGGGSAAAIVASLGAALVAMVGRITARSSRFAEFASTAEELVRRADVVRRGLQEARERDERAFTAVVQAQALPKGDDSQRSARTAALQHALAEAADAPLHCAALAGDVIELAHAVAAAGNTGLASDVGCAAEFGAAAVAACAYNVRVNHLYMRNTEAIDRQSSALEAIERDAFARATAVRELVIAALGRG